MKLQSGKLSVTKHKDGSNVPQKRPPESKEQAHELLFINQLHDRAKHGPSRRTIGSHVQRHIHRRKRLNSCIRLKSILRDDVHHVKDTHVFSRDYDLPGSISLNKSKSTSWKVPPGGKLGQARSISHRVPQDASKGHDKTLDLGTLHSPTQLPRDMHGFRFDPFNSYPIEFRESIPPAIDYCEQMPPCPGLC